jgi:hypothetical protein
VTIIGSKDIKLARILILYKQLRVGKKSGKEVWNKLCSLLLGE